MHDCSMGISLIVSCKVCKLISTAVHLPHLDGRNARIANDGDGICCLLLGFGSKDSIRKVSWLLLRSLLNLLYGVRDVAISCLREHHHKDSIEEGSQSEKAHRDGNVGKLIQLLDERTDHGS